MKIHIFGASGSGVTTLGKALAEELRYSYFDCDNYFWEKSDPPFTMRRDPEKRNALLLHDLSQVENWILGGSMVSWGDDWHKLFDLVVFLLIPADIRLERLKKREYERYGDIIYTDAVRNKQYQDFMVWASGYDNNTAQSQSGKSLGRTLQVHRDWIAQLKCRFMEITGDTSVEERINMILDAIAGK